MANRLTTGSNRSLRSHTENSHNPTQANPGNKPMRKLCTTLTISIFCSAAMLSSVMAGPATDSLASCLADNTTGKERKDLARWVYAGMSIHPEIQELSNVTNVNREDLDKSIATMFTKLITENCPAQAKLAVDQDGLTGFQTALGTIGQLAMQELLSNPDVNASFTNFTKYIDQNKINSVFNKK